MPRENKINRMIFSITLVLVIILSSTVVFAQEFTDVPDDHWASGYISKINALKVITGYSDETFRPDKNITNLEAIVSITRLFEIDGEDTNKIIEKYKGFIDEINLPDWAKEGIAIALEINLDSEDNLREKLSNESSENVKKVDVCKYIVKAMKLEEEVDNKILVSLPFKDNNEIEPKDAAYIEVLIEKGIINKSGDAEGNFNPDSPVSRAVMSKMLSMAYDHMFIYQKLNISFDEDENNLEENNNNTDEDKENFTITGTITGVLKAGDMMNLRILKDNGEEQLYQVLSNTKTILDGKEISTFNIVAGVILEAVVTDDYDILSINATSVEEEVSGELVSVITGTKNLVVIKNDNNEEIPRMTIDEVDVYINGQAGSLGDLKQGDTLSLKIKNDNVIKIIAESKIREYTGILTTVDFDNMPIIEFKDSYENIKRFDLDDNVTIIRNGEKVDFIDLRIGDEIHLTTEYDDVTMIEANVVRTETNGIINSIIIANTSKIVVANDNGEETTYLLCSNANIKIEDKHKNIYDLRLGHQVNLELESNVIVKLEAKQVEQEFKYMGEMIYKNEASNVIMIKTVDGENILINLTKGTSIIDVSGLKKSISSLKVGDELLVVSTSDGVTLIGKNIIIMQKGELD